MLNEVVKPNLANSRRGMTLVEVTVVIAVIVLLAVMLLPVNHGNARKATRINCINNLKQINLAMKTWSLDNDDKFPMQVSMTNRGTMEFAQRGDVFITFLVLSNELTTPKLLICPADKDRTPARSFDGSFNIENISYFVGIDASQEFPSSLVVGDGNLTNSTPPQNHILSLTTNDVFGWTEKLHNLQGNVALADGSVQQYSSARFRTALTTTGLATNRLAIP